VAKNIRFFLFILLFQSVSLALYSQVNVNTVTPQQATEVYQQAKSSGLTDAEVEAAAIAKGASADDIKTLKERLAAEKRAKNDVKTTGISERITETDIAQSNSAATPNTSSNVFGANVFRNSKISFEPNLRLPTPKNYILGTGDEIMVDITGYALAHYMAKVSPEGTIKLENLNPIFVSGLTIESASERIINRLRAIFPGLGTPKSGVAADITLGNIRSIKVMMIGEITQPGTFTLPSLATVFNALYAAGGPTDKGSFRNIEIYRGGKPYKKLDIYDFLLRGDQRNNVVLQDQDVIRIPVVKRQIEIDGAVKLPKVFEIEDNENLGTVLEFAGGYADNAYKSLIHVERITPLEKEAIGLLEKDINTFQLITGDRVVVDKILERFNNLVTLQGAVDRPGNYSLTQAKTVKGLLALAGGLRSDANKERVFISRLNKDAELELLSFNLQNVIVGTVADIELKSGDILDINSLTEIKQQYSVTISGEVQSPQTLNYKKELSLSDAIFEAGGFTDGANIDFIEVARRIKTPSKEFKEGDLTQIIRFKVDKDLKILAEEQQQMLEPYDQIIVRPTVNYVVQKFVTITGEVKYPGKYAIESSTDRISDIIQRAGGLRKDAYLHGTQIKKQGRIIGVELQNILASPGEINDLFVESGDEIEIPKFKQTVEVAGQVLNPLSVVYTGSSNVRDYINQAGGLTDTASTKRIYVRYINGKAAQTRSFLGIKKYPKVESGATIYVPVRKRRENKLSIAEATAITSTLSSIGLILLTVLRLNNTN
jgi:polysaccharide biosynthesis/export protein